MNTSSPGHVEAELVAKYLINFIDIQDLLEDDCDIDEEKFVLFIFYIA